MIHYSGACVKSATNLNPDSIELKRKTSFCARCCFLYHENGIKWYSTRHTTVYSGQKDSSILFPSTVLLHIILTHIKSQKQANRDYQSDQSVLPKNIHTHKQWNGIITRDSIFVLNRTRKLRPQTFLVVELCALFFGGWLRPKAPPFKNTLITDFAGAMTTNFSIDQMQKSLFRFHLLTRYHAKSIDWIQNWITTILSFQSWNLYCFCSVVKSKSWFV